MPDPTRPVAGAPIDTDWGQQVHDRVFQPPGVRVGDSVGQNVGATFEQVHFDTTLDDPGGWVSGDSLIVPTGRGGLYLAHTLIATSGGSDSGATRFQLRINGNKWIEYRVQHADSGAAQVGGGSTLVEVSAGDAITYWTCRTSGSNPAVKLLRGEWLMQGTSIGA